jgi:chromosome segregation ATPase
MDELQARLRARREAAGGATTAEQREGAAAEIARLRRQAEETRHDIRRQENLRNAAATEADRMLRQLTQLNAQQYIVVTDLDRIDRALNRVRGSLEQLIDLPDFASTPIRQRQTDVTNLSQRTAALKTRFERLTLQQQQTEARTFIGEIERIINEIKTMVESQEILVERPE